MSRYDLRVETYPIEQPLGGEQSWGAKAHIWELTSEKAKPVALHEHWGMTEDEARRKAQQEGRKWIAEHTLEDI